MKRYWVIAPYDSRHQEGFDASWDYDIKNGVVAIGWPRLGDISSLTDDKLIQKIKEVYPKENARSEDYIFRIVKCFYGEIKKGDTIIVRKGRKKIIGVGEVTEEAFYNIEMGRERYLGRGEDHVYPNFLKVQLEERQIDFDHMVFGMQTLFESTKDKFNLLIEGQELDEEVNEDTKINPSEFVLEKYLEDFIVSNFSTIFGAKYKLLADVEGFGQQYSTEIGTIDILVREVETNNYVVIELKKGRSSDKVVGQILRYMGWVKKNLAKKDEAVKGLIICKEKDEKLEYALDVIPQAGIDIKLYKVDFQLI